MSRRTSILKALAEKLKLLDGTNYDSNIYGNAYPKLKFWDEVNDFPSIYMSPGTEVRDYQLSGFAWGLLGISIKIYCRGDNAQEQLEQLLDDVEKVIDTNRALIYNDTNNHETTEILIASVTTDEGLLAPFAVGEINLQVRYQVM